MGSAARPNYRFGDLLALARQDWVRQMSRALADQGYPDYRITDAATTRLLRSGPLSVGELAAALGISRQAARKVGAGLEERGYAITERDAADARRLNLTLTPEGLAYTELIVRAIRRLNRRVVSRTTPTDLAVVDQVLRATIVDPNLRQRANRIPPPLDPRH